eukprot:gene4208-5982_t
MNQDLEINVRSQMYEPSKLSTTDYIPIPSDLNQNQQSISPSISQEPPLKVLLVVEPTPFTYVSGYANRFKEMLTYLKKGGDNVHIFTPDSTDNYPKDFLGFNITTVTGFQFPFYKQVTLTCDIKLQLNKIIENFKPDIVHVSTPSVILWPVIFWARKYDIPLVMSYHTDVIGYTKQYFKFIPMNIKIAKMFMKKVHDYADLTLCTSYQLKSDLEEIGVRRIDVWQKGINTKLFSPRYKDSTMREKLSEGNPDSPLLLYVGRLGVEKKLSRLKNVLIANPNARLAFVGKGPVKDQLEKEFQGFPVYFAGELHGEELSKAYSSCDIFVMPSDTETLGFVVLEGLASGLPAVAVAAGGLVDTVVHERTGFLVENNEDMVDFSNRVKQLIDNPTLRQLYGKNGVSDSESMSWESATSKLRNTQYRTAIALHRARDNAIDQKHIQNLENVLMKHNWGELN